MKTNFVKTALYLIVFLLGGFLIYKLILRFAGAPGQSGGGGSAGGYFGQTPTLRGGLAQPSQDNTGAIIGAAAGAFKSLAEIFRPGAGSTPTFSHPAVADGIPYTFDTSPVISQDVPYTDFSPSFYDSFYYSAPAVDYNPPATFDFATANTTTYFA